MVSFFIIYLVSDFGLLWVFVAGSGLCLASCAEWGLLFAAVCGLLTVVASLVAEHGLRTLTQ